MIILKIIIISWIVFTESRSECDLTKQAVASTVSNRSKNGWEWVLKRGQFSLEIPKRIYTADILIISKCIKYGVLTTLEVIPKRFRNNWYFLSGNKMKPKWAIKNKLILKTKNMKFYRR
jgi:hypothetical protein